MIWSDADGMEDNSWRLSEEGEDAAKKVKDTFLKPTPKENTHLPK